MPHQTIRYVVFQCSIDPSHSFGGASTYSPSTKQTTYSIYHYRTSSDQPWQWPSDPLRASLMPICPLPDCGGIADDDGPRRASINASVPDAVAFTVAYNPHTGEHMPLPTSSSPVPDRYAAEGFQRVQMKSFKSMERFGRATGTIHDFETDQPGGLDDDRNLKALRLEHNQRINEANAQVHADRLRERELLRERGNR